MRDYQPELVEDAIRAAGVSPADQRAAHRRWTAMQRSRRMPPGAAWHEAILGVADDVRIVSRGGFECRVRRWPVPELWPGLVWEVMTDASDLDVVNQWLVRATDSSASLCMDRLRPWSCVAADVIAAGGRPVDSDVPSRFHVVVDRPQGDVVCTFVWGLLQTTRTLDPAPEGPAATVRG